MTSKYSNYQCWSTAQKKHRGESRLHQNFSSLRHPCQNEGPWSRRCDSFLALPEQNLRLTVASKTLHALERSRYLQHAQPGKTSWSFTIQSPAIHTARSRVAHCSCSTRQRTTSSNPPAWAACLCESSFQKIHLTQVDKEKQTHSISAFRKLIAFATSLPHVPIR